MSLAPEAETALPVSPIANHAVAPPAPGKISDPVEPLQAQRYLDRLANWVQQRRDELTEIDAAVLRSANNASLTADISLSLMVWKAVADRLQLLLATWNGGRVGPREQLRLAVLIWGRLDATLDPGAEIGAQSGSDLASGVAVSLPEACRLSDALAGQLRARLQLDPAADANAARVKDLRATVERIRDQVSLEPPALRGPAEEELGRIAGRVAEIYAKAQRGGDVGGLLSPLELETARIERDLIVGAARRRDARGKVIRARDLLADLTARASAVSSLVERCLRTVTPPPNLAVPDIAALGPVPNTESALDEYLRKLDRVAKALNLAHNRYAESLTRYDDLVAELADLDAAAGQLTDPGLRTLAELAAQVLQRSPSPLVVAETLVRSYATWIQTLSEAERSPN